MFVANSNVRHVTNFCHSTIIVPLLGERIRQMERIDIRNFCPCVRCGRLKPRGEMRRDFCKRCRRRTSKHSAASSNRFGFDQRYIDKLSGRGSFAYITEAHGDED